jgi:hypothetical protein
MCIDDLKEMLKYKEHHNIKLEETARHFGIGINKFRKLLKQFNIKLPKKIVKRSDETIYKIKKTNLISKNSPLLQYNWEVEYKLFIEANKNDTTIGIKSFSESRGYNSRYLRKYITENNLYQPIGIPIRTEEWKSKISNANKGKVNNPKGSNGKLKGKRLKKSHRDNIRAGLVKSHYNISLHEWEALQDKKELYYREVWRITNQQPLELLENYDKRGNAGQYDAYQLDHIYPISKGFINGISPDVIGNINNLQMLYWLDNRKKGNIL